MKTKIIKKEFNNGQIVYIAQIKEWDKLSKSLIISFLKIPVFGWVALFVAYITTLFPYTYELKFTTLGAAKEKIKKELERERQIKEGAKIAKIKTKLIKKTVIKYP